MAQLLLKLIAELTGAQGRQDITPPPLEVATGATESCEIRQLTAGDNTFQRPDAATDALLIMLPPANVIVTAIKFANGDVAPPKLKPGGGWYALTLDPANLPTSVVINTAGAYAAGDYITVRWF
jgi:hypothetical protein